MEGVAWLDASGKLAVGDCGLEFVDVLIFYCPGFLIYFTGPAISCSFY